jgi:integrase
MAGKITELKARDMPIPATGETTLWDRELIGFGLRVRSTGSKTWIIKYRNREGRQCKITLPGGWPNVTVDAARREARRILGEAGTGRDPAAERRRQKLGRVTVGQVLDDYLATKSSLRPSTAETYRRLANKHLGDWLGKSMSSIAPDSVLERQKTITTATGPTAGNNVMRLLNALFAFAMQRYQTETHEAVFVRNPVKVLNTYKVWNKRERRQTVIRQHELPRWWQAVHELPNATWRDYLVFTLMTGLRRREASGLRWSEVDLPARSLTIPATRTKNGRSHTVPITPYLVAMLKRRQATTPGDLVFPPRAGAHELTTHTITAIVAEASGVRFTVHDLRRTFSTIAESLDVPAYALKKLLNHSDGGDVTSGYLIINTERLRGPMEKIEKTILSMARATPPTIVELRATSPA